MAPRTECYSFRRTLTVILLYAQFLQHTAFAEDDSTASNPANLDNNTSNDKSAKIDSNFEATTAAVLDRIFQVLTVLILMAVVALVIITTYSAISYCSQQRRRSKKLLSKQRNIISYESVSSKPHSSSAIEHEDDSKV